MEDQQNTVKNINAFLLKKGLINGEKSGFSYRHDNNASAILFQSFTSIISEISGNDTISLEQIPTDQMDEVVRLLHSKHGMKCVIFIFDEHILKAGEIRGPLTFDDYNFLGETNKPFVVQVHGRADEAMIKTNKNESSIGFIIRRRGLYVCGDDPTELLKRTLALHLAIKAKQSERVDIRIPRP